MGRMVPFQHVKTNSAQEGLCAGSIAVNGAVYRGWALYRLPEDRTEQEGFLNTMGPLSSKSVALTRITAMLRTTCDDVFSVWYYLRGT